jgi:hypothetical protein
MSKLKIIDTIKRAFNLLKQDPTLIALFILPAIFPTTSIITSYLSTVILFGLFRTPQNTSQMISILLSILFSIAGLLLEAWASAAAILKVTELEKGSKLGLKEALFRGLKKVPRLLVPAIAGLAIHILMYTSLMIALIPHMFTGMSSLVQGTGPSIIVLRVAMGFTFIIGLYVAIRLRLYAPACVLENNFGLKTSWKLVPGNWWRLFAIVLIFGAMSAIISQTPLIGSFLSSLIVNPFTITAMTLVYFQLREAASSGEDRKEFL